MKNELEIKNKLFEMFLAQLPQDVKSIDAKEVDKQKGEMLFKLDLKGKILDKNYVVGLYINEL